MKRNEFVLPGVGVALLGTGFFFATTTGLHSFWFEFIASLAIIALGISIAIKSGNH